MIKLIAILILSAATAATAERVRYLDGSIREGWPTRIGESIPDAAMLEAAGYRLPTQAELDAEAATLAAQAAASEAAMSLPAVFENGVAVVKDGHHVELVPLADGEPVVGIQISNSPLDPAIREQMKAAKLAEIAAKKAAKDATDKTELDKLVAAIDGAKNAKELGNAVVAYIKATKE